MKTYDYFILSLHVNLILRCIRYILNKTFLDGPKKKKKTHRANKKNLAKTQG